jgi:hypothetical protein
VVGLLNVLSLHHVRDDLVRLGKLPVFWIRIRKFLGLLDPDRDPLARGTDPTIL